MIQGPMSEMRNEVAQLIASVVSFYSEGFKKPDDINVAQATDQIMLLFNTHLKQALEELLAEGPGRRQKRVVGAGKVGLTTLAESFDIGFDTSSEQWIGLIKKQLEELGETQ